VLAFQQNFTPEECDCDSQWLCDVISAVAEFIVRVSHSRNAIGIHNGGGLKPGHACNLIARLSGVHCLTIVAANDHCLTIVAANSATTLKVLVLKRQRLVLGVW
jgi:hypothetical protein